MKKLNFSILVLAALFLSLICINNWGGKSTVIKSGEKSSGRTIGVPEPQLFVLQPEHPAYRLDGCILTSCKSDSLLFEFQRPGHSVLVLKANAPLMIKKQSGLTARLRPGWDGTLGYSLYALDVEAGAKGSGMVCLISGPVSSGPAQSQSEIDARNSRFPDKPEAFIKWQIEWRNKLAGRLMNGGLPKRVPLEAELLDTEDHPSFTLRRVRYKTQADRSNTLLISLPKNVSGAVPLLIALHGHETTWGEAAEGAFTNGHADDFCAYFAERGWAVVQPATMNHTLQHAGWTLQGEWTWDAMVAVDYATSLPEVDAQHVSVCGLSTGGHLAMNLLALDDRVGSGVVGCVLSTWNHYRQRMRIPPHCDCGILGQLGDLIEQCDWAALAAPKPVQFQHGRQDACYCPGADPALLNTEWNTYVMPEEEFGAIFTEVNKAYKLSGKPENVKLYFHNEGHRVNNEAAFEFLTEGKHGFAADFSSRKNNMLSTKTNPISVNAINSAIKELEGKISFQVWQYDSSKVRQKHVIPVTSGKSGNLQIENSTWKCDITESLPSNDGITKVEAKFRIEKGSLSSSGVAVAFDFSGWSINNYVMIPAIVYNGNRFRTIFGGYMPVYPPDMYYNKNCPLSFSDDPRLAMKTGELSKIELSTSNASTPAMTFFSPSKKRGFILLTGQNTRFGNSGMIVEENKEKTTASFCLTSPCVREKIPGFGGFFKSGDLAATWNAGDEVVIRFYVYSFPANDIPVFLQKFMDVRKDLTGENHPRNLTPMSAILKYTLWQTDNYRWYEDSDYKLYSLDVFENFFGYKKVFQLGWVGGMMNTYPVLYDNNSLHQFRATSTIDFVVDRMQGKSGYFYGFYCDGGVKTELKREIPKELIAEHPDVKVAMVRKNADALLWFCKQFMLLKEQGNKSLIKPSWENAAKRLATAFVNTWKKNGELGQYIDPENGEIVIFNSTAAAIAPGGLALASKYFNEPDFLKAAIDIANYYYTRDVVKLGLTTGHCGDISQDADSESAAGLLESLMALYWATGDRQWIDKARVQASLCSTWTLSYDYEFPPASDLGKLKIHAAGAYFASTQNKHAAPGICTSSGDYLFKLYRATGECKYAELIRDIQHAHTEVVETPGRPTVSIGSGGAWEANLKSNYWGCSMERIQPSDAEGKDGVGRLYRNTSNVWNELNGMLMAIELPGIYLQLDKKELMVFDHVEVSVVGHSLAGIVLQIKNPTAFPAKVSLFAETSADAIKPLSYTAFMKWGKIDIDAGQTRKVEVGPGGKIVYLD